MENSEQELASCVCNYTQVKGCRACVWSWDFRVGRKEERRGGVGGGGKKKERGSEARENLVILHMAAPLMDSACVYVCVSFRGV